MTGNTHVNLSKQRKLYLRICVCYPAPKSLKASTFQESTGIRKLRVISFLLFLISDSSDILSAHRTHQCSLRIYIFLSRDNPRLNWEQNQLCSKYTPWERGTGDPTGGRFTAPPIRCDQGIVPQMWGWTCGGWTIYPQRRPSEISHSWLPLLNIFLLVAKLWKLSFWKLNQKK